MIPPLVSFDVAKIHLRMINNDLDSDIDVKLRLASQIVANHCKFTDIPAEWISAESPIDSEAEEMAEESDELILLDTLTSPPDTLFVRVPGNIQAAVLLTLGNLFDNPEGEILTDTIKDLLTPFRDPTMA